MTAAVRLPDDLTARLDAAAAADYRSRSSLAAALIARGLAEPPADDEEESK